MSDDSFKGLMAEIDKALEAIEKLSEGETLGKYILDDEGNPLEERSLLKWAEWMETADRIVALDTIFPSELGGGRPLEISTVFLGIDHNWMPRRIPLLWETMIFGATCEPPPEIPSKWTQFRYYTRQEAEANHKRLVRIIIRWMRMKARRDA